MQNPPQRPNQSIVISDSKIIDFFNNSIVDPTKFLLLAIQYKDLFLENANQEKADFSKGELFRLKQDLIDFKEKQLQVKEKINEMLELLDTQKLPFLEQYLISKKILQQRVYKCPYCEKKSFLTKRALAGHTNKCRPMHEEEEEDEVEDSEVVESDET